MRVAATMILASLAASTAIAADRVGYRAIAAGDFAAAAQRLEAERRIHPQRPELMLNLVVAYRALGREADARALYMDVLTRPAVMMDMANGTTVSSLDLATLALSRPPVMLAGR